jgi:hypothetical protein
LEVLRHSYSFFASISFNHKERFAKVMPKQAKLFMHGNGLDFSEIKGFDELA